MGHNESETTRMTQPDSVDYSFGRPTSPAALAAKGIKLVARYLSPPPNAKNLTADEAAGLHAAGLGILLNWESDSGRPAGGAAYGSYDGAASVVYAESIGAPHGLCIFFSCDFNTTPADYPAIVAYFRAVNVALAGHYSVGVYGEADLIEYLHNAGVVTSEWQTYAWSNGRLSAQADLYQYLNGQSLAGASVDYDRIIHPDLLGAWWPSGLGFADAGSSQLGIGLAQAKEVDMAGVPLHGNDGNGSTYVFGSMYESKKHMPSPLEEAGCQLAIKANAMVEVGQLSPAFIASIPDAGSAALVSLDTAAVAGQISAAVVAALPAPVAGTSGPSLTDITNAFKNALDSATFTTTETSSSKVEVTV